MSRRNSDVICVQTDDFAKVILLICGDSRIQVKGTG